MAKLTTSKNLLALDVGEKRVGVAVASGIARIATPWGAIENNDDFMDKLKDLIKQEDAGIVIIGRPLNMNGEETAQTQVVRKFKNHLFGQISLPIIEQDETLTSRRAEAELNKRGKPYSKGDIDALAAP
jgi:putative Holliday junction resolvase